MIWKMSRRKKRMGSNSEAVTSSSFPILLPSIFFHPLTPPLTSFTFLHDTNILPNTNIQNTIPTRQSRRTESPTNKRFYPYSFHSTWHSDLSLAIVSNVEIIEWFDVDCVEADDGFGGYLTQSTLVVRFIQNSSSKKIVQEEKGYLPATSNKPEARALRTTTRFPKNLPANKITTVPGVMVDLILVGFLTGFGPFLAWTSSAG